jgi:hypothetical protein
MFLLMYCLLLLGATANGFLKIEFCLLNGFCEIFIHANLLKVKEKYLL